MDALIAIELADAKRTGNLFLSEFGLTEFPSQLVSSTFITEDELSSAILKLLLNRNNISAVPPEIACMTNLRVLNLANNKIRALPDEISHLANLEQLDVSNNQLAFLPSSLANLTALEELHLDGNKLSDLPSTFRALVNLRELYLGRNMFTALPLCVCELLQLRLLSASDNLSLSIVPKELVALSKLETVDFANTAVSDTVMRMAAKGASYLRGFLQK
eukprot:TRINITY_DN692_c0_g1_i2.p3 TRINITY_DN692_c0_g1~~TRINITY_DN692_c0_g1_i2.p3  ORF type:complete len:218 (-),score=53.98 TRINITY_DN692_c0_g1_i2:222-875(-)